MKWGLGVGTTPLNQTVGWWIDISTTPPTWTQKSSLPAGSTSGGNLVLDTSAASESVIYLNYNTNAVYRYDPSNDSWSTMANPGSIIMINGGTCAVNPGTKVLYCAGLKETGGGGPAGGVYTYSLAGGSSYLATDITGTLTGCTGLYSISNPGFKWDSAISKFVEYTGTGNSVILFDPVALSCSTATYSNGPTDPVADTYGIYDLWTYFPSLNKFAILANADSHVFTFVLGIGGSSFGGPVSIGGPVSQ